MNAQHPMNTQHSIVTLVCIGFSFISLLIAWGVSRKFEPDEKGGWLFFSRFLGGIGILAGPSFLNLLALSFRIPSLGAVVVFGDLPLLIMLYMAYTALYLLATSYVQHRKQPDDPVRIKKLVKDMTGLLICFVGCFLLCFIAEFTLFRVRLPLF